MCVAVKQMKYEVYQCVTAISLQWPVRSYNLLFMFLSSAVFTCIPSNMEKYI